MDLQQLDQERAAFLIAVYEMADADTMEMVADAALAQRLSLDDRTVDRLGRHHVENGLMTVPTMGGNISITPGGIVGAENMFRAGRKPPLSVLVLDPAEQAAVEGFLTAYRRSGIEDQLAGEDRAMATGQVETIEVQLRTPRPQRRIVRGALLVLADVLVNVAGSGAYAGLVELLKAL